jgi:phosphoglycolate phosphatase-like HAD superfamily hydrolase
MSSPVNPQDFDAVLFDLDGVLTTTRTVHAAAWMRTLDAFLRSGDARHGTRTAVFDERADYAAHVDGKPRQEGVRDLGSIPLCNVFAETFPDAEFRLLGVEEPPLPHPRPERERRPERDRPHGARRGALPQALRVDLGWTVTTGAGT